MAKAHGEETQSPSRRECRSKEEPGTPVRHADLSQFRDSFRSVSRFGCHDRSFLGRQYLALVHAILSRSLGNGLITYVRYGVYPIVSMIWNGRESAPLTEVQYGQQL